MTLIANYCFAGKILRHMGERFSLQGERYERFTLFWLPAIVAVLAFSSLAGSEPPKKGSQAIAFKAVTIDGKAVDFPGDYRGKLVILDFWATWCGPCTAEVPGLVKAYNQYHPKGLEVLGVSLDKPGDAQTVRRVMGQQHMTWDMILSKNEFKGHIPQLYGLEFIPSAFLVDGDTGRIIAGAGGALRGENLPKTLKAAFDRRTASAGQ